MLITLMLTLLAAVDLTVCICEQIMGWQIDGGRAGTGFNMHYTGIIVFVSLCGLHACVRCVFFPVRDNYSIPSSPLRSASLYCRVYVGTVTISVPTELRHISPTEITAKWSVKLITEQERRADCLLLSDIMLISLIELVSGSHLVELCVWLYEANRTENDKGHA